MDVTFKESEPYYPTSSIQQWPCVPFSSPTPFLSGISQERKSDNVTNNDIDDIPNEDVNIDDTNGIPNEDVEGGGISDEDDEGGDDVNISEDGIHSKELMP